MSNAPENQGKSPCGMRIRASWLLIGLLVIAAVTGIISANRYFKFHRLHEATAVIQVFALRQNLTALDEGSLDRDYPPYQSNPISTIQSRKILEPVIEKLGLQENWGARFDSGKSFSMERAVTFLQSRLDVKGSSRNSDSDIYRITVRNELSSEAASIANEIADVYASFRNDEEVAKRKRGFASFDKVIARQEKVVEEALEKFEKFRRQNSIELVGAGDEDEHPEFELKRVTKLLEDASAEYNAAKVRYEKLLELPTNEFLDALRGIGVEDTNLATLLAKKKQAQTDLEQMLKSGVSEQDPRIVSRRADLTRYNEQIEANVVGKKFALKRAVEISETPRPYGRGLFGYRADESALVRRITSPPSRTGVYCVILKTVPISSKKRLLISAKKRVRKQWRSC